MDKQNTETTPLTKTPYMIQAQTWSKQQEWLDNLTLSFIKEKSKKLDAKSVATQTD